MNLYFSSIILFLLPFTNFQKKKKANDIGCEFQQFGTEFINPIVVGVILMILQYYCNLSINENKERSPGINNCYNINIENNEYNYTQNIWEGNKKKTPLI